MNTIVIRIPIPVRLRQRVLQPLKQWANTLKRYRQRHRQRQLLATLDAWQLKDMGLTRSDVMMETEKPFWKP